MEQRKSKLNFEQKVESYVSQWEQRGYENGIPDEADTRLEQFGKVPSYRRICMAIMKNDLTLSTLGYQKPKSRVYTMLKRIEIRARENKKENLLF